MVRQLRMRRVPVIGDGGGWWSLLHIDDAASATVAAIESRANGILNVVDDQPALVREWLPALAETVGGKPRDAFRRGSPASSAAITWSP